MNLIPNLFSCYLNLILQRIQAAQVSRNDVKLTKVKSSHDTLLTPQQIIFTTIVKKLNQRSNWEIRSEPPPAKFESGVLDTMGGKSSKFSERPNFSSKIFCDIFKPQYSLRTAQYQLIIVDSPSNRFLNPTNSLTQA